MKLTYTVEEVAEVLGISKSSVYNLRNAGIKKITSNVLEITGEFVND